MFQIIYITLQSGNVLNKMETVATRTIVQIIIEMYCIYRHTVLPVLHKFPLTIDSCVRNLISHVLQFVWIIHYRNGKIRGL